MNIVFKTLFFCSAHMARARFIRNTRRMDELQERFLRKFIKDFSNTARGRDLGFRDIEGLSDFRKTIPASSYEDYRSYIERICSGEEHVLTPEPIVFLSLSGGTTGSGSSNKAKGAITGSIKGKLIPVTKTSHKHRNRARGVSTSFFCLAMAKRKLDFGSIVLTNCAVAMGKTAYGIPYGKTSAGDMSLNSFSYKGPNFFPYPYDAFYIDDGEARHYICLLFALRDRRTKIITANFPPFVLHLANLLDKYSESFIEDMQSGRISRQFNIPEKIRNKLQRHWKADVKRADELQSLLDQYGTLKPKHIWPDLSAVVTARGAPSHFYLDKFSSQYGDIDVFGGVYGATESLFGIYHDMNSDQAVLAINTAFYEFVPESEWDKPFPNTLLPAEVTEGQEYRVLVTNYAGLCRFDVGDIVRVNGWYEGAPTITFVRRKGGLISSTAEKTTELHIQTAIDLVQRNMAISLTDYCVTLVEDRTPSPYVLNIELAENAQLASPEELLRLFDRQLQNIHSSYKRNRADHIPAPLLRILAPGSFVHVRNRQATGPGADTNTKLQHVSEDRLYLAGMDIRSEYELLD